MSKGNSKIGSDISRAQSLLESGGVVAIPTETVYGLAANAFNEEAVARIFDIKNRPSFDPLIVHVGSPDQLSKLSDHSAKDLKHLLDKFWPGPLTIILEKLSNIPDLVTSGMNSVAIRMPNHPFTLELLNNLEFPLAAPSANPFGYISPTRAEHVNDQLGDKVDYILDGGPCQIGLESTILSLTESKPKILRLGGLEREKIETMIGQIDSNTHSTANPKAPGMLSSHYSPKKLLHLGDIIEMATDYPTNEICYLSFKTCHNFPGIALSKTGNLREAAKNLFSALRELDKFSQSIILAELLPNEGLGRAINDRLRRAATQR
ncbi:MAG: threonylcarbamoyl-AMP synthase [Flavobacteriales bacterium]|nr:threonylcarbamoyl-AMP synthase [Flavobacteriales bacterium]